MAILAGAGVAGAILYYAHKRHERCAEFPDIYSSSGPIHLQPDADMELREFIAMKLDDAAISGIDISEGELQKQGAEYISPHCDWDTRDTTKAQQVWSSIGVIARHMRAEAVQG